MGRAVIGTLSLYRLAGESLAGPPGAAQDVADAAGVAPADAMAVLRSPAFLASTQLTQLARAVLDGTVDLPGR